MVSSDLCLFFFAHVVSVTISSCFASIWYHKATRKVDQLALELRILKVLAFASRIASASNKEATRNQGIATRSKNASSSS